MEEKKNVFKENWLVFKENWLKEDEKCVACGQVTKRVRGITKQNIRSLLIPKFNMTEFTITLLLIVIILLGLMYRGETQQSRDWLKPMTNGSIAQCKEVCSERCDKLPIQMQTEREIPNFSLANYSIKP
jgi:hypothetical protein